MHQFRKTISALSIIFSVTLMGEYKISIIYESGFEFKSQHLLINDLKECSSKKEIENLVSDQDWIKDYYLAYKPFKKENVGTFEDYHRNGYLEKFDLYKEHLGQQHYHLIFEVNKRILILKAVRLGQQRM